MKKTLKSLILYVSPLLALPIMSLAYPVGSKV